jgi:hypothetical protein
LRKPIENNATLYARVGRRQEKDVKIKEKRGRNRQPPHAVLRA